VALLGTTVPVNVSGVPTVAVVGTLVIFVTGIWVIVHCANKVVVDVGL